MIQQMLARPLIAVRNGFSAEDRARQRRELETETMEMKAIITGLERLALNPAWDEPRLLTLIEIWWRSYHNLKLMLAAAVMDDPASSDWLSEMLIARKERWARIKVSRVDRGALVMTADAKTICFALAITLAAFSWAWLALAVGG
jgi:hypothetical protein